ncbi:MAG: trypsin-like peptidase domain-containing protein [Candidatus Acidiferrales bacterium]
MKTWLRAGLCALAATMWFAPQSRAESLSITSSPPGATVEINGLVVGVTPVHVNYPGGYFHKTKTVFGTRLEHSMRARIYKDGYTVQEVELTEGPFEWVALNGRDHGRYWLLKANQIVATLRLTSKVFDGAVRTSSARGATIDYRPELTAERVVEIASAAIVKLRDGRKEGTGFLITDTGLIATNHHVVEGDTTVTVILAEAELPGQVVYTDAAMDLALVKITGQGFPHVSLANHLDLRPGQTVIAIGNPGRGLPGTVTKGVVSAIGHIPAAGPGTWIQTDAAINPGNSGGPLLDTHGDVVGINTWKPVGDEGPIPLQGIGFALSAEDLAQLLQRFYPVSSAPQETASSVPATLVGVGNLQINSDPSGSEIYIDGNFVGQTPSTIPVSAGRHKILLKSSGRKSWERDMEVLNGGELTLHPVLEQSP